MLRLAARRIAREAVALAQAREAPRAARDHLVHVGLVAGVPDDRVVRAVENAVKCERELHHAEVWREVAAGFRDLLDQERADLGRKLRELLLVKALQVGWGGDRFERSHYR